MPEAPPDRAAAPRVVSIPSGVPFLDTLALGLLDGALIEGVALRADPFRLARTTIFLPTRRAARDLERAFVRALGGAALLPRIAPLGDVADFEEFDEEPLAGAIPELERRLVLTRLVLHWAKTLGAAIVPRRPDEALLIPASPADAAALGGELARLMDALETEQVALERIGETIPEELDASWKLIQDFLVIAGRWWPDFLAERGLATPVARRDARLAAYGEALMRRPPDAPVIVAGSTGTVPATAALMEVVARLPLGAVVLPGLDRHGLDDLGWAAAARPDARAFTHPQHALATLIARLGVAREDVREIGTPPADRAARARLAATALRPAETTDAWFRAPLPAEDVSLALGAVHVIEAANERAEALAVAVALRETLEEPGATAALVTPDRGLAARVVAELARWNIAVEDSAGCPLRDTPDGTLLSLLLDVVVEDFAPLPLAALMKHPRVHFGLEPEAYAASAQALELAALRGTHPPPGIAGLRATLQSLADQAAGENGSGMLARRQLLHGDIERALDLVNRLEAAFAPLRGIDPARETAIASLGRALVETAHAAGMDEGDALAMVAEIAAVGDGTLQLRLGEFAPFLATVLGWRVARPGESGHPRIRILGSIEARLLSFDRVVLAGLVEGGWPPQTRSDPWLSRGMRRQLGLPPPEWRIGLSAHDFEQALGNAQVVLSYARKLDGAPTVPARWLQRLATVSGPAWTLARERGARFVQLAEALDATNLAPNLREPRPTPPRALRPTRLSVTEIETLVRDPYSVYAKHVLKLRALDPVGAEPDASDRGTIIHDALADFIAGGHDPAAADAFAILCSYGKKRFAPLVIFPDVKTLWWPRFQRIARWFLAWEAKRRPGIAASHVEQSGRLEWRLASGRTFALSVRADRIDVRTDGTAEILDYKTGIPPTDRQVRSGLSPQLPLEAAMLAQGAFAKVPVARAGGLSYVRLSGGFPPGEERPVRLDDVTVDELSELTLKEAKGLLDRFEDPATPYRALVHPMFKRRAWGDYEHLARIAEWSGAAEGEGET